MIYISDNCYIRETIDGWDYPCPYPGCKGTVHESELRPEIKPLPLYCNTCGREVIKVGEDWIKK
jgi:hypothetical protein